MVCDGVSVRSGKVRCSVVHRAGVAATVVNDAVMVPADVIKQRLQLNQGRYRGVLDCVMQTWKLEGIGAFYRQASSSSA